MLRSLTTQEIVSARKVLVMFSTINFSLGNFANSSKVQFSQPGHREMDPRRVVSDRDRPRFGLSQGGNSSIESGASTPKVVGPSSRTAYAQPPLRARAGAPHNGSQNNSTPHVNTTARFQPQKTPAMSNAFSPNHAPYHATQSDHGYYYTAPGSHYYQSHGFDSRAQVGFSGPHGHPAAQSSQGHMSYQGYVPQPGNPGFSVPPGPGLGAEHAPPQHGTYGPHQPTPMPNTPGLLSPAESFNPATAASMSGQNVPWPNAPPPPNSSFHSGSQMPFVSQYPAQYMSYDNYYDNGMARQEGYPNHRVHGYADLQGHRGGGPRRYTSKGTMRKRENSMPHWDHGIPQGGNITTYQRQDQDHRRGNRRSSKGSTWRRESVTGNEPFPDMAPEAYEETFSYPRSSGNLSYEHTNPNILWVGGIPEGVAEMELKAHFGEFDVTINKPRGDMGSRYVFVAFKSPEDATLALAKNGSKLRGMPLIVQRSRYNNNPQSRFRASFASRGGKGKQAGFNNSGTRSRQSTVNSRHSSFMQDDPLTQEMVDPGLPSISKRHRKTTLVKPASEEVPDKMAATVDTLKPEDMTDENVHPKVQSKVVGKDSVKEDKERKKQSKDAQSCVRFF